MAPVTRGFLEHFEMQQTQSARSGVPAQHRRYHPFRLVRCTLHLGQLERNLTCSMKKVPKLQLKSARKTNGRIIRPLTFSVFSPKMLTEPSREGNVSYIVDMNKLLRRFPRVYDAGMSNSGAVCTQTLLLTRWQRDVSRYTPLVCATPETPGDVWWQDDEQNYILSPENSGGQDFSLRIEVDMLPSDYKWLKRQGACEFMDHEACSRYGELCPSLLPRSVVWQACHFAESS
ncbi:hypothetical protein FHG87_006483 [Trinorchestia longiramus]|nr:hypothetical protein FHG87_006483 [Trinorchestia longiramus]